MSNLSSNEDLKTREPEGMMCSTCKYKLDPVTVAGYTQDRSGFGSCKKYVRKPHEVLWDGTQCEEYRSEQA